jgi:hypothetical protein
MTLTLSMAEKQADSSWRKFNRNEAAAILASWILKDLPVSELPAESKKGILPESPSNDSRFVIKSTEHYSALSVNIGYEMATESNGQTANEDSPVEFLANKGRIQTAFKHR